MLSVDSIVDLPLDVKLQIYTRDVNSWIFFAIYDNEFYEYTRIKADIFVKVFTKYSYAYDADYEGYSKIEMWKLFGRLHRCNDLPAVVSKTFQQWYYNGKLHRDYDQPAVMYDYGKMLWFRHGNLHRDTYLDGKLQPAVIRDDIGEYWINGVNVGLFTSIYNIYVDLTKWLGY